MSMKKLLVLLITMSVVVLTGTVVFAEGTPTTHVSNPIDVNGTPADIKGYNIGGHNYFKLRDLAQSLTGTEAHFQVVWDEENRRVVLTPDMDYAPDGTEDLEKLPDPDPKAVKTTSEIWFGGETVELDAYVVDGYNYVKLRDIASLVDFAVNYYHETHSVSFLTDKPYSESQDFYPETPDDPDPPADPDPPVDPEPGTDVITDPSGLFQTQEINYYSKYFTNLVDGYKIMVQRTMEPNMQFSEFRTVLENSELTLEVYNQPISGASDYASYINYGNKFINDTSTYKKLYSGYMNFAGKSAYVLEWSRAKLSKVPGDKNYYACVDLKLSNTKVLTFFFKSTQPFDVAGTKSYISIMNTLKLVGSTAKAVNTQTQWVENTHWNSETRKLYDEYFGGSKLTWGIYEPMAPFSFYNLKTKEAKLDYTFKFLIYYTNINTDLPKLQTVLKNAADEDRTVELTLQTPYQSSGNMILDALNGKHDTFLHQYAAIVANNKKPIVFRVCNEMNGDWCPYSAYHTSKDTKMYIEFYKYVYEIFRQEGALPYTIWVFNPNERAFPNYTWNHALSYYPGDEYVDVIGLTGYNTGTYYSDETWRSFKKIYDAFYWQYNAWFGQPFMITEFACSNYGGDKAAWVRDMFNQIRSYPRIKVAIWWDGRDLDSKGNIARSYFIDDNEAAVQVFRENLKKYQ